MQYRIKSQDWILRQKKAQVENSNKDWSSIDGDLSLLSFLFDRCCMVNENWVKGYGSPYSIFAVKFKLVLRCLILKTKLLELKDTLTTE